VRSVLVKLSSEGEEQVIAAFAKMAEGAKKHGKDTEGSLASIKNVAAELGKTLIGLFALEQVVHGFGELVKGAIETGEQLSRLHRQTGISTDSLQAYAYAARQAGVDGDAMTTAMGRLARSIFAAQQGSAGATTALAALGLHVRDFIGLTPDQQFDKVALALGRMQDHTKAQAAAQLLMGRGAAQLLPVFQDVAEKGIGGYVERLKELGVYQSTELIAQFKQVQEEAKNLKTEVTGLATQFAAGLAPAVSHAMQTILHQTASGTDGFKSLGATIGWLVDVTVTGLAVMGSAIGEYLGKVSTLSDRNLEIMKDKNASILDVLKAGAHYLSFGVFQEAPAEFGGTASAASRFAELFRKGPAGYATATPPPETPPTGLGDEVGGPHGEAIAKAREQLQQQLLDNELNAYKAQAAKREALEKESFESGATTLAKYFDDRAQIINERAVEEIDVLVRKRAAAAAVPIDEDNQIKALAQRKELAKLDGEIAAINAARERELATLATERFAADKRNTDAQEKAEQALAKLRGDHLTEQRAQLEKNLAELDRTLARGGVGAGERGAAVDTARARGTAVIDFGEQARQAKVQFEDLNIELAKIKDAQASGNLFPVQAAQQTIDLERQRLPILQGIVDQMTRLAALAHDPALVEQAKQAQQHIDGLKVSTDQAGTELAKLKDVAQVSLTDGLSKGILDTINNIKSAGDAARAFGLQFAQAIEAAIVKLLVMKSIQAIGLFSGGGAVTPAVGKAEGGWIPGVGNTDSVPLMGTPGEFVIRKDVASQPGMHALLEAINGGALRGKPVGGVPHYAAGGFVGGASAPAPQFKVINVLDPSVLGDHLATAPGEQSVINIMARHPNRIREALGS
jgi:hypothetical protein